MCVCVWLLRSLRKHMRNICNSFQIKTFSFETNSPHLLISICWYIPFVYLQLNFHNNEKNKPITGANLLQRHSINSLLEQQDLIWSPNIDGEYGRMFIVYTFILCWFWYETRTHHSNFISKSKPKGIRLRGYLCNLRPRRWAYDPYRLCICFVFLFQWYSQKISSQSTRNSR